jgi:hypothetical protein
MATLAWQAPSFSSGLITIMEDEEQNYSSHIIFLMPHIFNVRIFTSLEVDHVDLGTEGRGP